MNRTHNHIILDNPAIPVLSPEAAPAFGELVDISQIMKKVFDPQYFVSEDGITVKDLYLTNFSMRMLETELAHDAVISDQNNTGGNLPGCYLFPNGYFKSQLKGYQKYTETFRGEQNFLFDPHAESSTWCPSHTPIQAVHISIHPDFFEQLLPEDEKWSDEIRRKIGKQELIHGDRSPSITLEQQRILQYVLNNPLTGKMGLYMQEACLTQIVLLQLHLLFQQDPENSQPKIYKRDREIMHAVKDYITKNFTTDHSLASLSRHFGVNQHKLTTAFKQLFGVSIFEYISLLKMEYAKKLLENEGLMVNEIAPLLGYKNPHHFATAFKRKFGVNPSKLRG